MLMKLCILRLCVMLTSAVVAQASRPEQSRFVRANLPGGVSIDVPKGWTFTGPDEKRLLETYAESVWDLTNLPHGKAGMLLGATAPKRAGYMSITIVLEHRQTATQMQVRQIPRSQLAELDKQNRKDIEAGSAYNGLKIVSWEGATVEEIGGYWAIVKRYAYTLPGESARKMENCQFLLGDKIVSLLLQSGESTFVPAKPIFERVKSKLSLK